MKGNQRQDFHKYIVDQLLSEAAVPVLLHGGPGQGKTTTLREITRILQAKSNCLQIYMPFNGICYSPEFFDRHSLNICSNSLSANAEGLDTELREQFFQLGKTRLKIFPALENLVEKYKIKIIIQIDEISDLNILKSYPGYSDIFDYFCQRHIKSGPLLFLATTSFRKKVAEEFAESAIIFKQYEVPPLSIKEIENFISGSGLAEFTDIAPEVFKLTWGNQGYVKAFLDHALRGQPPIDINTVVSSFLPDAALELKCRFNYEYLVGKSRGDGIIRYLLSELSFMKRPNLTEIASQINRSLGVTKDYLKWMMAVGLIDSELKRYSFEDPLLKTWINLFRSGLRPTKKMVEGQISKVLSENLHLRKRDQLDYSNLLASLHPENLIVQEETETEEIILPKLKPIK